MQTENNQCLHLPNPSAALMQLEDCGLMLTQAFAAPHFYVRMQQDVQLCQRAQHFLVHGRICQMFRHTSEVKRQA